VFEVVSVAGNDITLSDEKFRTDYTLCELLFDSLNPATPQTKIGTNNSFLYAVLLMFSSSFCAK
jgi:hypothetical protein